MSLWIHLSVVLALAIPVSAGAAAPATPFKQTASTDRFSPEYGSTRFVDGRLSLSQYGKSGNAFDIVSLDPITLEPRVVIEERKGGQFIAQDDRFLVLQQDGDVADPVIVLDANTHQELGRVRLKQRVSWGRIDGDRLLLIQSSVSSAGYEKTAPALIYALPSLQLLHSTTIAGGNGQQSWGEYIVSLGQEVAVYDAQFEQVGTTVTFPALPSKGNVSCAAKGPLLITRSKAVVAANCGEIYIVDLPTRSIDRKLDGYSHFYSTQVIDNILFTAALAEESPKEVRAFDLTSGRLLANLPIDGSRGLFSAGSQLVALSPRREGYYEKAVISSFAIDTASLVEGSWRLSQVVDACPRGERIVAQSNDIYRAIELCRRAGIEGFVGAKDLPPMVRELLENYATWQSQTFDQPEDATRTLQWLVGNGTPIDKASKALSEASARRKMMIKAAGPTAALELDQGEAGSEIGRAIVEGQAGIPIRWIRLNAPIPRLVDPDGEVVYGWNNMYAAMLYTYDRETLNEIDAILVGSQDEESQDTIDAVAADARHIYVSVRNDGESTERPNFVVIDKATREIVTSTHLSTGAASLKMHNGELLTCDCEQKTCHSVDTQSFTTAEHEFVDCSNPDSVVRSDLYEASELPSRGARWVFKRKSDGQKIEVEFARAIGVPLLPEQSHTAIFLTAQQFQRSVVLADLRTGTLQTLLRLPELKGLTSGPAIAASGQTLFISYGRDLMLLDLRTFRVWKYFPDFIPGSPGYHPNNIDPNGITEMHIDADRLIIRTFNGAKSAVVSVRDLTAPE